MKTFFALLKREFGRFFKNKTLLLAFFGAPVIYALVLGFLYKSGKVIEQPIIVVDQDNSPMSNQLIEMLDDNEKLQVVKVFPEKIGIDNAIIKHKAVAAIIIPERFEADILQKKYPELTNYISTVNLVTANYTSTALQVTLGSFNAGVEIAALQKQGMSPAKAAQSYEPVKFNYIKLYNPTGNYLNYMWPAFLAVVLQQVILLAMAISFSAEMEERTFVPEFANKVPNSLVALLIKVIPFWLSAVVVVSLYYLFHILFNAPLPTHAINYVVSTGLFVMACTFLGTFISLLVPNALKATQILMLMAAPSFMIGGYSWPSESMPIGIQYLANILPLTPFINAHKAMLIQGASLNQVMPYLQHLVLLIVVYLIISIVVYLWRSKSWEKQWAANN